MPMPIDGGARRSRHAKHTIESLKEKAFLNPVNGCWEWNLSLNTHGYGQTSHDGKVYGSHRLMYILTHPRADLKGKFICHHCDNRRCINPNHIYAGTPTQNQIDRVVRNPHSFSGGKKGEEHQDAKLTEEQVKEIRQSSLGYRSLGKIYGVDRSTIKLIKKRVTWKHVP